MKPGVSAAICSGFDVGAELAPSSDAPPGSASRPRLSGRSTSTWRSKRPARSSAGSRISGRLVAASRTRPLDGSKPSSSASSWFERLLLLVVAAAAEGAAGAAERVELVDEDDRRRVLARLLEQVAHPRRADADEHLDEFRAGDREERHAGLAGDGARQQRLAGARRADQQHALRQAPAEPPVAVRGPSGSRRSRAARPWPRRRRRRRRR